MWKTIDDVANTLFGLTLFAGTVAFLVSVFVR